MPRLSRIIASAALLAIGSAATGCGAAESHGTARMKPLASPTTQDRATRPIRDAADEPVATVAGRAITLGTLQHWLSNSIYAQFEPTLSLLIHDQWLIGEAAEDGLKVEEARLTREAALGGPHGAEVRQTLAKTGETLADFKFTLRVGQLSEQIYRKLERKIPTITPTQVAEYYERHKRNFAVPELRDLHILRAATDAAADKAKREIDGGTSFAAIVKKSELAQPITAHEGLLFGLARRDYPEPPLSAEIFRARLRMVVGPVKTSLGYYVFEVIRTTPAHQRTLAESKPEIAAHLHQQLRNRVLSPFIAAFRRTWISRTDCRPGYVVKFCRQFKQSNAESAEPPTAL